MPLETGSGANAERRTKRGRPRKFGRPSQLVAVTIPTDVLQWLRSIHSDVGWAIVSLHKQFLSSKTPKRTRAGTPQAELVRLTERQSLIVVNPSTFRGVKGISVLPTESGRAFLALQNGQGIADLELAISDCLDSDVVSGSKREALAEVREQVKAWRRSPGWRAEARSIILIERRRLKGNVAERNDL